MTRRPLQSAVVLAALALATPAAASTVSFERECGIDDLGLGGRCSRNPVFRAGPGEANDVEVRSDLSETNHLVVSFQDPGSVMAAGPRCAAFDPHLVLCDAGEHGIAQPIVELGDGGDTALSRDSSTILRGGAGSGLTEFHALWRWPARGWGRKRPADKPRWRGQRSVWERGRRRPGLHHVGLRRLPVRRARRRSSEGRPGRRHAGRWPRSGPGPRWTGGRPSKQPRRPARPRDLRKGPGRRPDRRARPHVRLRGLSRSL